MGVVYSLASYWLDSEVPNVNILFHDDTDHEFLVETDRRFDEDYELLDTVLGVGMNGPVRIARNKKTGVEAATKFLMKSVANGNEESVGSESPSHSSSSSAKRLESTSDLTTQTWQS